MEENLSGNPDELKQEDYKITPVQNISLTDALAGVFSEPGETFSAIKQSTRSTYWVWPIIILAFVTALAAFTVFNDEELSSEITKMQMDAVKERLDKAVKSGDITRDQAKEQLEASQNMFGGGIMRGIGIGGGFLGVFFFFFILALVYWLIFRLLNGSGTYINFLNVMGLASVISSIQHIINTVLAVFMGKLYINIGPVLLFTEEQLGKGLFKFVASFDLLSIWYLAVIAIGFAKVSDIKSSVTFSVVFGLWILWSLLSSFVLSAFTGI